MKKWPTYRILELDLNWTFFSFFGGKNWAIGFIKLKTVEESHEQSS